MKIYYKQKIISSKNRIERGGCSIDEQIPPGPVIAFNLPAAIITLEDPGKDVFFLCKGDRVLIEAHRCVLMKQEYFNGLLAGGFSDGKNDKPIELDISSKDFLLLLNYLYGGVQLNYADSSRLYAIADKFGITSLMDLLINFFEHEIQNEKINIETLVGILDSLLGDELTKNQKISSLLYTFIYNHFENILLSEDGLFETVFSTDFFNRNEDLAKIVIQVINTWEAHTTNEPPLSYLLSMKSSYERVQVFLDRAQGAAKDLHSFFHNSIFSALKNESAQSLELVLSRMPEEVKKSILKAHDTTGNSPLDIAVCHMHLDMVRVLCWAGAQGISIDSFQPLMQSDAVAHSVAVVKLVVESISRSKKNGALQILLLLAIKLSANQIIDWFIEQNTQPQTSHVMTAALKFETAPEIFGKIVRAASLEMLMAPCTDTSIEKTRILSSLLYRETTSFKNPSSIVSMVRILMEKGVSVSKADFEAIGPLHIVARYSNNYELVKALFNNASTSALLQTDEDGKTPGDYGIYSENKSIRSFIKAEYAAKGIAIAKPQKEAAAPLAPLRGASRPPSSENLGSVESVLAYLRGNEIDDGSAAAAAPAHQSKRSLRKKVGSLFARRDKPTPLPNEVKCLIVGDATNDTKRKFINTFPPNGYPYPDRHIRGNTVIDSKEIAVELNRDRRVGVSIWDSSGQEDHDALRRFSYPGTNILFFVYSDLIGLRNIKQRWIPEATEYCPTAKIVLVYCDDFEIKNATNGGAFCPTSADLEQFGRVLAEVNGMVFETRDVTRNVSTLRGLLSMHDLLKKLYDVRK